MALREFKAERGREGVAWDIRRLRMDGGSRARSQSAAILLSVPAEADSYPS